LDPQGPPVEREGLVRRAAECGSLRDELQQDHDVRMIRSEGLDPLLELSALELLEVPRAIIRGLRALSDFEFEFNMALMNRHLHPAMKDLEVPQVPAYAEAMRPRAIWFLELLDKELAKREFIAGDRYSVADITTLVAVDFMKPAKLAMPEGAGNVKRWHAAASARPSAIA